jgi:hypothetical protein
MMPIAQTIQHRMVGRLVNIELETMWKKVIVA